MGKVTFDRSRHLFPSRFVRVILTLYAGQSITLVPQGSMLSSPITADVVAQEVPLDVEVNLHMEK